MRKIIKVILILSMCNIAAFGQHTDIPFPLIGEIEPRTSNEIYKNNWSVGGETMDRDLIEFEQWKNYLGDLGAKQIRLQAGWAKIEKKKGVYDFEWLDKIIEEVSRQGLAPWLQLSYGNPIYKGGGGIHLSGGLPTSEKALAAWDDWVKAVTNRYKDQVKIYEIWNEPENKDVTKPEEYAALYVRTAKIIKQQVPDATIYALSLGNVHEEGMEFTKALLDTLKAIKRLDLVDDITLHGYTYNPDEVYQYYEKFIPLIGQYSDRIRLRQGELGAPSENQSVYALKNYEWTETSQAKWLLRKLLGDLGRDIPSSYFLIMDIVYTHYHDEKMDAPQRNTKGLIEGDINRKFVKLKPSYRAFQHITATFDHVLERLPNYPYEAQTDTSLSVFGYRSKHTDWQVVTVWMDSAIPNNTFQKTKVDFEFPQGKFEDPVFIDMISGKVYDIPEENWLRKGTHYFFKNIPVYDSPVIIAEKKLIRYKAQTEK